MRKALLAFFALLFSINMVVSATDYYVSSSGNDSSTGLSASAPWKTINKVNSEFSKFVAGDRILFKKGDTFYGTLTISKSGTSGSPITISSYGTGELAIISGFTTVTGWNNEGNGIYSKSVTCESTPNMVTVNGVNTPIGRYPNTGWNYANSYSGTSSLTDSDLPSSPDMTGGTVVVRTRRWVIDKSIISSHSGTSLSYNNLGNYTPQHSDNGYFIQNVPGILDVFGEWCYRNGTFYMYFGSKTPTSYTIKVASLNNLIRINGNNYITIDNISLQGANTNAIDLNNTGYITVQSTKINFSGLRAIYCTGTSSAYDVVQKNAIDNSNSIGLEFTSATSHATITNNTINNTGSIVGMGEGGDGSYTGIVCIGDYGTVTYNNIYNCGYVGIRVQGIGMNINYNLIDTFCSIKDDGAGIYAYRDYNTGNINYNTILNGVGAFSGWSTTAYYENELAHGIYMDGSQNKTMSHNNIAHCVGAGIFNNEASYSTISYNTFFDNLRSLYQTSNVGSVEAYGRNNAFNHNIYVAKKTDQYTFSIATKDGASEIPNFGTSDNNYFVRPISNDNYIEVWYYVWGTSRFEDNLSEWQSVSGGKDNNSKTTPITISDINKVRFEYNATGSNKTVTLDAGYVDVTGTKYAGSITIAPYSSAVLMVDPNPSTPAAVPVYVSSSIANATPAKLEITYNTTLSSTLPSVSAFTVRVNSTARTINSVTVSGAKVILTLSSAVVSGDVVTVAYTKPSSNPLQTPAGGQAASIAAQTVTNNVGSINIAPVAVVSYKSSAYSGFVSEINASGSYDANKDKLSFSWTVPSNIDVSSTTGSTIEFLSPIVNETKKVEFILNVSDGKTTQSKSVPVEILPYEPELDVAEVINIEASGYQTPYYPYNIIDGNIGTMWSANGADQWLILELKDPFSIQHVKLSFQPGQTKESYFDVLGSNDKETWEPILTKEASCAFSGDLQVFDFPPSKAVNEYKYVKLVGEANSVDTWNSISEFRIFGYKHKYPTSYEEQPVKIYPNPASEFFNVKIENSEFTHDFIRIVSITGKIMYNEKTDPDVNEFRVPIDLKKGVYIVQMGSGDMTVFSQKLVVTN